MQIGQLFYAGAAGNVPLNKRADPKAGPYVDRNKSPLPVQRLHAP